MATWFRAALLSRSAVHGVVVYVQPASECCSSSCAIISKVRRTRRDDLTTILGWSVARSMSWIEIRRQHLDLRSLETRGHTSAPPPDTPHDRNGLDCRIELRNVRGMEVNPTPDQEISIRLALATGRIARPEEAAAQAMALWEQRERRRRELMAQVDAAEVSLARGEGLEITEASMQALADAVQQRGRARLREDADRH